MTYQVTFTQSNNPDKPPITVADGTINSTTSINFVGKNYTGYASVVASDMLHMLENFANDTAPTNPVQGQLWFDTASGINLLKVYDGTTWQPAGSLKKATNAPASALAGDLWVNTNTSQLFLYSGSTWVLVGPQYSAGLTSGPVVESIVDTANISHNVVTIYASSSASTTVSYRVAIISEDAFTPKAAIAGYPTINTGINVASTKSSADTGSQYTALWGTASSADALLISGTAVPSSNFLRSDIATIANNTISIRNDGGLTVGANLGFNIGINGNTTLFYSKNSGNPIEIALNNNGTVNTALHLTADAKLGLGNSNTSPQGTLDVIGGAYIKDDPTTQAISWTNLTAVTAGQYLAAGLNYYLVVTSGTTGTVSPTDTSGSNISDGTATIKFVSAIPTTTKPVPGRLIVQGTSDTDATSGSPFDPGGASIQTAGGLSVAKKSSFGDDVTTYGQNYINYLDSDNNPVAASVILPGSDSAANTYDIGSVSRPFRNVFAQTFSGNFSGTLNGATLTGSQGVAASAAKLQSTTVLQLQGDVTSDGLEFNGQSLTGTQLFTTSINQSIITNKTAATDSIPTDTFLVYRSGTGLISMTKNVLMNHVATVPIGCIFPYAGLATNVPNGYLLCDGSELQINKYSALFAVIQYTYKAPGLLVGLSTFALPDLRGRFPLGADNMNNALTVPNKDGSGSFVTAGGGVANRVTDVTADTVGAGSGSNTVTLGPNNLPDHKHNLNDGVQQFYAVGAPNSATDPNTNISSGKGLTATSQSGQGYGLTDSGSVISNSHATPVVVMNPYQTINYIIFTGVL